MDESRFEVITGCADNELLRTCEATATAPLWRSSSAIVYRAVHLREQFVGEHQHDSVAITIPLLGKLATTVGSKLVHFTAAGAVFHPPGMPHSGSNSWMGLEAIELELDADFVTHLGFGRLLKQSHCGQGGHVGTAALRLARASIRSGRNDATFASALRDLLSALAQPPMSKPPRWLAELDAAIAEKPESSTSELADKLNVSPQWLSEAYREYAGEGLHQASRLRRIEAAAIALRHTDDPLSVVALHAGFFDQSHMTRHFRHLVGRTPLQVRRGRMGRTSRGGPKRSTG